jgi:peptidoglycan hydrolase-like protein with peptidoglycan-binding domain
MRRVVVAGAAAGLTALGAGAVAIGTSGSGGSAEAATTNGVVATAAVARRDLVLRDDVDGTLGYGDARELVASAPGTVTRLPEEGTVVRRGHSLYDVDARGVRLLYGTMPLWRRLAVGVSDGQDVEQLERNLVELRHDPNGMTIDEKFDADTAAAVRSWQDALGIPETGAVEPGDAVFLPGPRRVGQLETSLGAQLQPAQAVMQVTGTVPVVEIDLDARQQELARVGAAVQVELPSGRVVRGTIASVGKVAEASTTAQGEPGDPTVSVVVQLVDPARRDGLDGAPVIVSLERERAKGVLAAPVEAILALKGGGDALEVVRSDGEHVLTAVETGTFADGYVEVTGRGIAEGTKVVVPE